MDLVVPPGIAAIHIGENLRKEHGAVERAVEDRPVVYRASFHGKMVESFRPRVPRLLVNTIEIPVRNFRREVGAGALNAGEGDAGLHRHHLARSGWKLAVKAEMLPVLLAASRQDLGVLAGGDEIGIVDSLAPYRSDGCCHSRPAAASRSTRRPW